MWSKDERIYIDSIHNKITNKKKFIKIYNKFYEFKRNEISSMILGMFLLYPTNIVDHLDHLYMGIIYSKLMKCSCLFIGNIMKLGSMRFSHFNLKIKEIPQQAYNMLCEYKDLLDPKIKIYQDVKFIKYKDDINMLAKISGVK